jgi:hypothetical protein
MAQCRHQQLTLVGKQGRKLRCCHCHLTIDEKELEQGYCPECWEVSGVRRRELEELAPENEEVVRYRCEACGVLIETV